jgi:hypothetical protein
MKFPSGKDCVQASKGAEAMKAKQGRFTMTCVASISIVFLRRQKEDLR